MLHRLTQRPYDRVLLLISIDVNTSILRNDFRMCELVNLTYIWVCEGLRYKKRGNDTCSNVQQTQKTKLILFKSIFCLQTWYKSSPGRWFSVKGILWQKEQ